MIATREQSEIVAPAGPLVNPDFTARFAQAHEAGGFDRVLIGYGAGWAEGWGVANAALRATERLKMLIAHRPGFVAPTLFARQATTLDHFTGGGRVAVHYITGGDEIDQRRDTEFQVRMPEVQPNFMLPFVRKGIDPFSDLFEVTLRGEGTVRGTGGLRIVDDNCQTPVSGLFAAGDAATRELVACATSGGGAQNAAWALSSGIWAGRAAVDVGRREPVHADEPLHPFGQAGLRPSRNGKALDTRAIITAIQNEMHPYDKNIFRSGARLRQSLDVLDGLWTDIRDHSHGTGQSRVRARETAAMAATARWCYTAAVARAESRGTHRVPILLSWTRVWHTDSPSAVMTTCGLASKLP